MSCFFQLNNTNPGLASNALGHVWRHMRGELFKPETPVVDKFVVAKALGNYCVNEAERKRHVSAWPHWEP